MAQRLGGILGAPAPIRIHGEQRDVTEHDDRCVTGQRRDIFGNKVQLLGAQVPKLFQIECVDQLDFVAKDVAALPSDTPIIVFSHIPLFAMYPDWGWGTDDSAQALSHLRRFSSVTCLNGHVHQVFSKTEGNVTFHSGTTTAYPLPAPGDGPAPKPVTLPAGKLHDALGIREVSYTRGQSTLALKEKALQ